MAPSYDIRCYDPDANEDFTFPCAKGTTFSSLHHALFVIEVTPKSNMRNSCRRLSSCAGREPYAQLLSAALRATSSIGFVSVSQLTNRLRGQGIPEIEKGQKLNGSGLGYFEAQSDEANRLLVSRERIQSYEEWIVGGCTQRFDLPAGQPKWYQKALCFDLEFFLQQADRVGCLFYASGETQEDIILLRLWDGARDLIATFVSSDV